ncbi:replicative helicase loader/inhibitor [Anaerophilus nitritogenes]|uniref:replicative helicase loader/inhibitor n=1 Tax=Anaerophilus nitritogenes TaxID=2498136 RepID=UPI0013EA4371|nr:replicative helicase loader/inhibitor [Anaerophilus nitritogenes]
MDKKQLIEGLTVLESVYDNFRILNDDKTMLVWYKIFKEDDPKLFEMAVETYIATNEFKPTPAGVRKCMEKLATNHNLNGAEAWGKVMELIKKYGWYRADEALKEVKHDKPLHKAVQALGFRELCTSENLMADRAHFLKIYEQYMKRESDKVMLPGRVQNDLKQLQKVNQVTKLLSEKFEMGKTS